ncbi:hypothetical protein EDC56_2753 [Sinobacterium caligoides]|uniref:Uncharacterized protein n=1 Tax=Sinobacterium caligoides TaxID=933926 RepID=A0A3N2DK16_9GAMM|nr:hypothetical protein [Sinobacterium caligoides]ROS00117.1 hypothetical protein EDC56_2753 [Sinobacterium caligoides]
MRLVKEKIGQAVQRLQLDLSGKIVLTEAATGPYSVTAIIAALAGAKVYAYAKDTRYGTVSDVFSSMQAMMAMFDGLDITLVDVLTKELLSQADIITNSGHLRPLDSSKLQHAKPGLVIPMMYEAWELRNDDIDMDYCRRQQIVVVATDERAANVGVFDYLGDMAVKLIFDAGCCLQNNSFVLICNNDFGPYIAARVSKLCDRLGIIDIEDNKARYSLNEHCEWLSNYPDITIPEYYANAEAIIFTAAPFTKEHIARAGDIPVEVLARVFNQPLVLRFAGDLNTADLDRLGIDYYPQKVRSGHMGILPSDIGFDPIIRLQAGSLWSAAAALGN